MASLPQLVVGCLALIGAFVVLRLIATAILETVNLGCSVLIAVGLLALGWWAWSAGWFARLDLSLVGL